MQFHAESESDTRDLGRVLAQCLQNGDVVTLNGPLGAGKTQFAQGIGEGLGIEQKLLSPTFNIVFEYDSSEIKLYHFDLYRLEEVAELEDVDFYALTDADADGASLIEWAELFFEEMPDERLDLTINILESGARSICATPHGSRATALLDSWKRLLGEGA